MDYLDLVNLEGLRRRVVCHLDSDGLRCPADGYALLDYGPDSGCHVASKINEGRPIQGHGEGEIPRCLLLHVNHAFDDVRFLWKYELAGCPVSIDSVRRPVVV